MYPLPAPIPILASPSRCSSCWSSDTCRCNQDTPPGEATQGTTDIQRHCGLLQEDPEGWGSKSFLEGCTRYVQVWESSLYWNFSLNIPDMTWTASFPLPGVLSYNLPFTRCIILTWTYNLPDGFPLLPETLTRVLPLSGLNYVESTLYQVWTCW